jgi:hypothetical protein
MPEPLLCLVIPSNAVFADWVPLDVLRAPTGAGIGEFVGDLVGGHFQVIRCGAGAWMYLNEDGKELGLPENMVATAVAHEAGLSLADFIVGQVVVFGAPDDEGWDTSVPEEFLALLEARGCQIMRRPTENSAIDQS